MSDNNQVKNSNQSSTSTVTASPSSTSTTGSTSTLNSHASGQALAGALWEALSELTTAFNDCIDTYRQIGMSAQTIANDMTKHKADADKQKSKDQAYQFYADGAAKGFSAVCTLGSMGVGYLANRGPSAELNPIDTNITKLNTAKANVELPLPNAQPGNGGPGVGDNMNQNGQEPAVFAGNDKVRYDQLREGGIDEFNRTNYTPEQDHELFSRMNNIQKDEVRANLKKQTELLDNKKNTFENIKTRNQSIGQAVAQLATALGDGAASGIRAWKQEDIGQKDADATNAGNAQQQAAGLIGTAGSSQSKMADSANQAIQTYGQIEQSNANPNR